MKAFFDALIAALVEILKALDKPKKPEPEPPVQPPTVPPVTPPVVAPNPPAPVTSRAFQPGQFYDWPSPDRITDLDLRFGFQGLDGSAFPDHDGWLWAIKGHSSTGHEYSLQFHIYREGDNAQIRLITQNFTPGLCAPHPHCDVNDGISGMVFDPSARYDVHIYGPVPHTTRGFPVWRMDMTTGGAHVGTWEVPHYGSFASVDYIRIGNGEIFDGRPGQSKPLTVYMDYE